MSHTTRNLIIILGDQLDEFATVLNHFDPTQDKIWMAEVLEESTHVMSSKQRSTFFLSAMRHFATQLKNKGWPVIYSQLDDDNNSGSLAGELEKAIQKDDENLAKNYEKLIEDTNFFTAYEKKKKDLEQLMEDWENVQMEIEDFN